MSESEERLEVLLERVESHWPDLLRQGSLVKKFADRADGPYVLQFRQRRTGTRDGRQKRFYVGPKPLADRLMERIWQRREEAGTRYRPGHGPPPEKRPRPELNLNILLFRMIAESEAVRRTET